MISFHIESLDRVWPFRVVQSCEMWCREYHLVIAFILTKDNALNKLHENKFLLQSCTKNYFLLQWVKIECFRKSLWKCSKSTTSTTAAVWVPVKNHYTNDFGSIDENCPIGGCKLLEYTRKILCIFYTLFKVQLTLLRLIIFIEIIV